MEKEKKKKRNEREFFEAWRKNRRARVRVFHSRLRVTSGEREAFKLREWLFLSFTEHKREETRGKKYKNRRKRRGGRR